MPSKQVINAIYSSGFLRRPSTFDEISQLIWCSLSNFKSNGRFRQIFEGFLEYMNCKQVINAIREIIEEMIKMLTQGSDCSSLDNIRLCAYF
jgi:hypothetical protein